MSPCDKRSLQLLFLVSQTLFPAHHLASCHPSGLSTHVLSSEGLCLCPPKVGLLFTPWGTSQYISLPLGFTDYSLVLCSLSTSPVNYELQEGGNQENPAISMSPVLNTMPEACWALVSLSHCCVINHPKVSV